MLLNRIAVSGLFLTAVVAFAGEEAVSPAPPKADSPAQKSNILETLKSDGHYKTLLGLIEAAGMAQDFRAVGQLTLFAPTDEALQRSNNLEVLKSDPTALRNVLSNHVVGGAFTIAQLQKVTSLNMRGGLIFTISADGRRIHDANIVQADVEASNGVVQGIDVALLLNRGPDAAPVTQPSGDITLKRIEGKVERDTKITAKNTGDTIYSGLKEGSDKTYGGLKTGTKKIKNFFTGD